jgi:hypothetical protein
MRGIHSTSIVKHTKNSSECFWTRDVGHDRSVKRCVQLTRTGHDMSLRSCQALLRSTFNLCDRLWALGQLRRAVNAAAASCVPGLMCI